jgi:uncharacterized membrane protein YeaQ/YmgE (transglycosylase-associated protein family)
MPGVAITHMWGKLRALSEGATSPSPNNPQGFVLTTVLGIVGSVVATFLGRAIHLYGSDQGAGIIASIVGALIVLWGWHQIVRNR